MTVEDTVRNLVLPRLAGTRVSRGEIRAQCPFHRTSDPNNPSKTFFFSLTKGVYRCWSCGASGSLRKFLGEMGADARQVDALVSPIQNELSQRGDRAKYDKSDEKFLRDHSVADELPEAFLGIFRRCPKRLLDAGFSKSTLKHFEVGYDPWYRRITYPIRNIDGALLGIVGGATLEQDFPKYEVYTSHYLTWDLAPRSLDRGNTVWNGHTLVGDEGKVSGGTLVVVEGYKACMWVYQCGFPRVVALSGSDATQVQMALLARIAPDPQKAPIVLMLDGDKAGRYGARKIRKYLKTNGYANVRLINLPDGEQPDDQDPSYIQEICNA